MLGNLIKYEFKATGRVFLPMFGALIIVAAISRLFSSLSFQTPTIIGTIISVIVIIGIFVLTLIITIQRFHKNLLSNEGYLMFTLPVSTDSLIISKLIVASIWNIASVIIVLIAVAIMAMTGITFQEIADAFKEFITFFHVNNGQLTLYGIEAIIVTVLSLFSGILTIYACIALSLLVNKHRGLFAFGMFVAINIISQTIASFGVLAFKVFNIQDFFLSLSSFQMVHVVAVFMIAVSAISCAVFYILTRLMLKRKLNLE